MAGQVVSDTVSAVKGSVIATSGPVTDTGSSETYQYNASSGAITFNLPSATVGMKRGYRNATGKSGIITLRLAAGNTLDYGGSNSVAAGSLASAGALADEVTLFCDAANHWYATSQSGTWTKGA